MQQIELTQDHVVKIMLAHDECRQKLRDNPKNDFLVGKLLGIELVLNTLGVYIDGVNWYPDAQEVIEDAQNNETSGS